MIDTFKNIDISKTCNDQTLLLQIVSGLHTSINMHVATNYVRSDKQLAPNYELYLRTIGRFPERLRNLYFLFSLLLKAVTKAEPLLIQDFQESKSQIESIIHLIKNQCDDPFDESYFFREDQKRSQMLQMKGKFMNISKILDCISCEKCRLNGKVQIKGLGTAMKLLFSPDSPGITYSRLELIVSF